MVPADVTTQVLQVKNFGCDYIYLMTPETGVIPWLKELDRQNFRPTIFGSTGLAAAEVWQATGKLSVGTIAYQFGPQWQETNYPMVKLLHELNAKWHPEVKSRVGHYIRGFAEMMTLAEALKRAIETSGFEKLNGETMKTAMETIKDFDPGIGSTYTWTSTDHQGIAGCRWYKWTDEGQLVSASDWYTFAPLPDEWKTTAWWLTE
jgi:branched-chain amino acid transport system substrate-binding protein